MGLVVHRVGLTYNRRIASEAALPELVAQNQDGTSVGFVVIINKRPAVKRDYAEDAEEIRRDDAGVNPLGFASTEQAECHRMKLNHRFKSVVLRPVVFNFLDREQQVVNTGCRLPLLQMNQMIAAGEGQRVNQDGVRGA